MKIYVAEFLISKKEGKQKKFFFQADINVYVHRFSEEILVFFVLKLHSKCRVS